MKYWKLLYMLTGSTTLSLSLVISQLARTKGFLLTKVRPRGTLIASAIVKAIEKLREYHFLIRPNSLSVSTSKSFSLQNTPSLQANHSNWRTNQMIQQLLNSACKTIMICQYFVGQYLPMPNYWSAHHWQITIFCLPSLIIAVIIASLWTGLWSSDFFCPNREPVHRLIIAGLVSRHGCLNALKILTSRKPQLEREPSIVAISLQHTRKLFWFPPEFFHRLRNGILDFLRCEFLKWLYVTPFSVFLINPNLSFYPVWLIKTIIILFRLYLGWQGWACNVRPAFSSSNALCLKIVKKKILRSVLFADEKCLISSRRAFHENG